MKERGEINEEASKIRKNEDEHKCGVRGRIPARTKERQQGAKKKRQIKKSS